MSNDLIELRAFVGREVRVSCGCSVVECVPRLIDGDGRFVMGRATVVVPCAERERHVELVREIFECADAVAGGRRDLDVDEIAAAMEERL